MFSSNSMLGTTDLRTSFPTTTAAKEPPLLTAPAKKKKKKAKKKVMAQELHYLLTSKKMPSLQLLNVDIASRLQGFQMNGKLIFPKKKQLKIDIGEPSLLAPRLTSDYLAREGSSIIGIADHFGMMSEQELIVLATQTLNQNLVTDRLSETSVGPKVMKDSTPDRREHELQSSRHFTGSQNTPSQASKQVQFQFEDTYERPKGPRIYMSFHQQRAEARLLNSVSPRRKASISRPVDGGPNSSRSRLKKAMGKRPGAALPQKESDTVQAQPPSAYSPQQFKMIEDSPNKEIYKKIEHELLEYSHNEHLQKASNKIFHRCLDKRCLGNSVCPFQRMEPIMDNLALRPQPANFGFQTRQAQLNTQQHAETDFPDRLLAEKKPHLSVIATEESLDDWHAQALQVPADKLQKQRRFLHQLTRQKKDAPKKASPVKSDDGSLSRKERESQERIKTMNFGPMENQANVDLNFLVKQIRPANYKYQPKGSKELKPMVYSRYENKKSMVTLFHQGSRRRTISREAHHQSDGHSEMEQSSSVPKMSSDINYGDKQPYITEIERLDSSDMVELSLVKQHSSQSTQNLRLTSQQKQMSKSSSFFFQPKMFQEVNNSNQATSRVSTEGGPESTRRGEQSRIIPILSNKQKVSKEAQLAYMAKEKPSVFKHYQSQDPRLKVLNYKNSQSRRLLMQEVGGFKDRSIFKQYIKQTQDRLKAMKDEKVKIVEGDKDRLYRGLGSRNDNPVYKKQKEELKTLIDRHPSPPKTKPLQDDILRKLQVEEEKPARAREKAIAQEVLAKQHAVQIKKREFLKQKAIQSQQRQRTQKVAKVKEALHLKQETIKKQLVPFQEREPAGAVSNVNKRLFEQTVRSRQPGLTIPTATNPYCLNEGGLNSNPTFKILQHQIQQNASLDALLKRQYKSQLLGSSVNRWDGSSKNEEEASQQSSFVQIDDGADDLEYARMMVSGKGLATEGLESRKVGTTNRISQYDLKLRIPGQLDLESPSANPPQKKHILVRAQSVKTKLTTIGTEGVVEGGAREPLLSKQFQQTKPLMKHEQTTTDDLSMSFRESKRIDKGGGTTEQETTARDQKQVSNGWSKADLEKTAQEINNTGTSIRVGTNVFDNFQVKKFGKFSFLTASKTQDSLVPSTHRTAISKISKRVEKPRQYIDPSGHDTSTSNWPMKLNCSSKDSLDQLIDFQDQQSQETLQTEARPDLDGQQIYHDMFYMKELDKMAGSKLEMGTAAEMVRDEKNFYSINQSLKGPAINSANQQEVIRILQEKCFQHQKSQARAMLTDKQEADRVRQNQALQKEVNIQRMNKMQSHEVSPQNSVERNTTLQSISFDNSLDDQMLLIELTTHSLQHSFQPETLNHPQSTFVEKVILHEIEKDNNLDIEKDAPGRVQAEDLRGAFQTDITCKALVPDTKMKKRRFTFQDSEFWFLKGFDHQSTKNINEMDSAIDSYRQAIRLNFQFAEAMHNLACAYEQQERYDLSTKWFQMATKFKPDQLDSYHGYALSQMKRGKPGMALEYLDHAISALQGIEVTKRIHFDRFYYRYLRCLCYRLLGDFEMSRKDYREIQSNFAVQEGKQISKQIFAMVIMPLEQNRKKLLKFVDQFSGIIEKYEVKKDRKILCQHYLDFIDKNQVYVKENVHPKWFDKRIADVLETLRGLSFFKRFEMRRLREMMEEMTLLLVAPMDVIFFDPNKVYIVVSGSVLMQNHQQQSDLPVTFAKFGVGDIMNFLQGESAYFNSIETFFLAQVEAEIAVFSKEYFQRVWEEDLLTHDLLLQRSLLVCHKVFSQLSQLTVMSLVSEFIEIRKYKKGEVIIPQSKFSPSYSKYQVFFSFHKSTFEEKLRRNQIQSSKQRSPVRSTRQNNTLGRSEVTAKEVAHQSSASQALVESDSENSTLKVPASPSRPRRWTKNSQSLKKDFDLKKMQTTLGLGIAKQVSNFTKISAKKQKTKLSLPEDSTRNGVPSFKESNPFPDTDEEDEEEDVTRMATMPFPQVEDTQTVDEPPPVEEGFFLIKSGHCQVVNYDDGFIGKHITTGEFFGESDILKTIGYEFFGQVIASDPPAFSKAAAAEKTSELAPVEEKESQEMDRGEVSSSTIKEAEREGSRSSPASASAAASEEHVVECMFIKKENFMKIPLYEQMLIKEFAESRADIKTLGYQYSEKYKIDLSEYQGYYN